MADYTAREWSGGDIVTAANLNHIEQGVASAGGAEPLIVKVSNGIGGTFDHTWQEIADAPMAWLETEYVNASGTVGFLRTQLIATRFHSQDVKPYSVLFINRDDEKVAYSTTSADGYPSTGGIN